MERWVSGILAALAVGGISALVVVYGDVGKLKTDSTTNRREIDRLDERTRVTAEAEARLEERVKCLQVCTATH